MSGIFHYMEHNQQSNTSNSFVFPIAHSLSDIDLESNTFADSIRY